MDFDLIMQSITAGLTGDFETDRDYLQEQMEKYKEHEMSTEIIRACGRIMYEILPDDKKEEISKLMEKDSMGIDSTLEEVRFNIYQKNYEKALTIMEALVKKVDELAESGMFQDDNVSQYFTFYETFEELLYEDIYKPSKDLRHSDIPYAAIYLQYGSLLVDVNSIDEANTVLAKAVRWDPVSAKIAFEYTETFKMLGDLERFFECSKEIFKIAFKPKDLARCYRNLAYYFVEKELWSEAIGCNLMSLQYDRNAANAQSELYYIQHRTNGLVSEPSLEEFEAYGKKYGFPIGPDENILGLSYTYGRYFTEEGQFKAARYFLTIFYNLTGNQDIKNILEKLPEE